jgi:hypothetical protein
MMSDLRVDVVDAHDAMVSKGHPISPLQYIPNATGRHANEPLFIARLFLQNTAISDFM